MRVYGKIEIHNVVENPNRFMVCRLVNGQLWFWSSWDNENQADMIASTFENGIVIEREAENGTDED